MGLRPAKCYRKLERPYTRVSKRKPKKSYVKAVPAPKIQKFEMGNKKKEFKSKLYLVSKQSLQIRHNSLEAIRISINKYLENKIGNENFFFKILVYPHHVMRENPLATGAGADRYQTGMRKAYGKPIGLAARVYASKRLLEVRVDEKNLEFVKKALKVANSKLSAKCMITNN